MQIDDVLEWARDGKWHILETHPQVIAEAFEQLADLRVSASRPTPRAVDVATVTHKTGCAYPVGMCNCGAFAKSQRN